ncbi:KIN17-like protein [Penicillium hetheringtonii]|uniref:KIN17-like protein n=1 Tax=Penicillium hetheringtonii TaxID=911720 RepID=A0AAD6H0S1_9EURO|nr:KIN17-like protein [Penicillium hetheringtonii]
MPKAEAGSTKAIANASRRKGLGRLRWYCQACEKQCPDENGFKCHVQSESHVRQMMLIGEDSKSHIEGFSREFLKNFIDTLKTAHGTKSIHANHFYQEIIRDKSHIHLNATKWKSLTQFVAYLGKEGICKVEETEKGLHIAWIDNSPETLRKREALLKKERQDKGDEEREQKAIRQQVERAQRQAAEREREKKEEEDEDVEERMLRREEGEKVKLDFGLKGKTDEATPTSAGNETGTVADTSAVTTESAAADLPADSSKPKISMSFGAQKPKNVFASGPKKNPLAGKKGPVLAAPKKMSEQERIMKAEMEAQERKRSRPASGFNNKRPKISLS